MGVGVLEVIAQPARGVEAKQIPPLSPKARYPLLTDPSTAGASGLFAS
jgi:hypothetical protein